MVRIIVVNNIVYKIVRKEVGRFRIVLGFKFFVFGNLCIFE